MNARLDVWLSDMVFEIEDTKMPPPEGLNRAEEEVKSELSSDNPWKKSERRHAA